MTFRIKCDIICVLLKGGGNTVFTKEELREIYDVLYDCCSIDIMMGEYQDYKNVGNKLLAPIITTTKRFKYQQYGIDPWRLTTEQINARNVMALPNYEDPIQDTYTEENILEELRRLPENKISGIYSDAIVFYEKYPQKWIELVKKIVDDKNLKGFVERHPWLIFNGGWHGRSDFIKKFIDAGVDIRLGEHGECNDDGALHFAAHNGHSETMRLLLEAGAQITNNIAWVGALSLNTDVVKVAIEYGADYSNDDCTRDALIKAVDYCDTEMIRVLLEAGANPAIEGYKALNIAYKKSERGKEKKIYKSIYNMLECYLEKRIIEKSKTQTHEESKGQSRQLKPKVD